MTGEALSSLAGCYSETVVSVLARYRALARLCAFPCPDGYALRLARTPQQQEQVNRLVSRMYAWRGYSMQSSAYPSNDPNRTTLALWRGETAVATLTLGCDSPNGLLADGLYSQEISRLRGRGRLLCEVTRLAMHAEVSSGPLLGALFLAAFVFGREYYQASDVVIEVNPRHVHFYKQRFGFRQLGALRYCPRVNAPAVLLHQTEALLSVFAPRFDAMLEGREAWRDEPVELAAAG